MSKDDIFKQCGIKGLSLNENILAISNYPGTANLNKVDIILAFPKTISLE